jgi:hypothetical protein
MEMKKWHFHHTKRYIEALDAVYVRREELEAKKEDIEGDGGEEEHERNEKMKEKEEVSPMTMKLYLLV